MNELAAAGWRPLIRNAILRGFVGGLVLAGFLAGAVAVYARPFFRPLDLLWCLPLLIALAVPLIVLMVLVASLPSARAAGPGRGGSIVLSLAVGAVVFAYLAGLWWRQDFEEVGFTSVVYLVVAAGVAALISVLAGPGRLNVVILAAILFCTGALGVAVLAPPGGLPPAGDRIAATPFSVRPGADRLLFIGVDGLDGGLIQDFVARGTLARLLDGMRGGSTFPLHRAEELDSPDFWSRALTGRMVRSSREDERSGEEVPVIVSSTRDRVAGSAADAARRFLLAEGRDPLQRENACSRRLWEIAALRRSVASIGWPESWPARPLEDPASSLVVSAQLLPALLAGRSEGSFTWPDGRVSELSARFQQDRASLAAEFEMRFPTAGSALIRQWLWESFLIDGYRWRLAREEGIVRGIDTVFVHFPGLAILRARLVSHGAARELHTLLEISEALELYVRWIDGLLGDALQAPPGWTVVLVGNPGREAGGATEGFVVVGGRRGRAGCVGRSLELEDVAPLVLDLFGFPPSAEMAGRPPEQCLIAAASPDAPVETYGQRRQCRAENGPDWDGAMLDRLESLGYLD